MSDTNIQSLEQLVASCPPSQSPRWHLYMIQPPVGGGMTTIDQLAVIAESSDVTALTISGLTQESFEFLVRNFGEQFSAIHFWKCPRLSDLTPLEDLSQLTHVAFYWNQRATRFWNFGRTPRLRGLNFHDFTRLQNLNDLHAARSLEELEFGDMIWDSLVVPTLEPLSALGGLRKLTFSAKQIQDGRIEPLAGLKSLVDISFPSRLFSTEQVAWLHAHLPHARESVALQPFRSLRQPIQRHGKLLDVLVVGKRKPFLSSSADAARLRRYVEQFDSLAAQYAAEPALEPLQGDA